MHKVRSHALQESCFNGLESLVFVLCFFPLAFSLPMFIEGQMGWGIFITCLSVLFCSYSYYKYSSYRSKIHSKRQPYPAEIIDSFYRWNKGDKIKTPTTASRSAIIKGEYVGVASDNSIVIEVENSWKPVETLSGSKVHKPKYYELPPNLFKYGGYENTSLLERVRESEEERILNQLEDSYTDEITEKVKEEIQKEKKRNELEKPERPEVEYLREYENAS